MYRQIWHKTISMALTLALLGMAVFPFAQPVFATMRAGGYNSIPEVLFTGNFTSGQAASLVLGQADFTSGGSGMTASTLYHPDTTAFDSSGNLWVADRNNNRVLEYAAPFSSGMDATLVLGQADFTSGGSGTTANTLNAPTGLAFDSSGNLWVADSFNNRVLKYVKGAGFTTGMDATLVLGQADFTSGGSGTTANTLYLPAGLAFDSGNLWVADYYNSRVLEYAAPFSSGMSATLVLGQANLNSGSSNRGGPQEKYTLSLPIGLAFDSSGNLWVGDSGNNRVLKYVKGAGFTTGMDATLVLGQADFVHNSAGTTADTLKMPWGLAFDSSWNLWVADRGNNRVLEYAAPFSSGMSATLVLGQQNLTSGGFGTTADTLYEPARPAFDSSGNLWVGDYSNNRVLKYLPATATPTVTGISPTTGDYTTSPVSVNITGTNFDSTASPAPAVTFSGSGVTAGTATVVSSTQISCSVTITSSAAFGARDVIVTQGGKTGTGSGLFTVGKYITVTAPSAISLGIMTVGQANSNNSTTAGSVLTNATTWSVTAIDGKSTNKGYMTLVSNVNTKLTNLLLIGKAASPTDNATAGFIYTQGGGTSLPFWVKQTVSTSDTGGSYTITITFTGSTS